MASGEADLRGESLDCRHEKGDPPKRIPFFSELANAYFRWFERCLFISNMLTRSLPPKIGLSVASATISRLF